ncbi:tetratricopeptide repeat protein [Leptospira noguchii]|uniref:tetratricopeptide repeat protein n=1 Tax=Leptospira noguchii TaxID=28182 RepID=UPI001F4386D0|nr:hypothetical protein [Leptospira noguchii]
MIYENLRPDSYVIQTKTFPNEENVCRRPMTEIEQVEALLFGEIEESLRAKDYTTARRLVNEAIALSAPCPGWLKAMVFHRMALVEDFEGSTIQGIEYLKKAIDCYPQYPPGWYSLACFEARLGNKQNVLPALENAIKFGWSQSRVDYRRGIKNESDFETFRSDADFLALVDDGYPENKALRRVFEYLAAYEPMSAINSGRKNLDQIDDLYALYQAFEFAIAMIQRDLDEHGSRNLRLYKLKSMSEVVSLTENFKNEVANREKRGEQTDTFAKFCAKIFPGKN